jgi:hypothetical protein
MYVQLKSVEIKNWAEFVFVTVVKLYCTGISNIAKKITLRCTGILLININELRDYGADQRSHKRLNSLMRVIFELYNENKMLEQNSERFKSVLAKGNSRNCGKSVIAVIDM